MTVKQKQWQLYYLGYLGADISAIDGRWGPRSAGATREFQRSNGIRVDGIFGVSTEAKSREVISALQEAVGSYHTRALEVDGLAGRSTMAATIRYQAARGLTPDGIAGQTTRARIGLAAPVPQEPPETAGQEDWWAQIRHFKREEFRCRCGRYCDGFPAEPREDLVRLADAARDHFGRPAVVVSGLRCRQHNANVGGVANSQHMYGEACDLTIPGVSAFSLLTFLRGRPGVRYAYKINETNVHFDIPKGGN